MLKINVSFFIYLLRTCKRQLKKAMTDIEKMDPEAFITLWDLTIDKMVRFHDNISTEVQQLIITIQKTRDGEGNKMVPMAEEKAAFGKVSLEI